MLTPVTTSSIIADNWSTCSASSISSRPAGIHCQRLRTYGASAGAPARPAITATATRNDSTSAPTPIVVTARLASRRSRLIDPFAKNPTNGNSSTSHTHPTVAGIIPSVD